MEKTHKITAETSTWLTNKQNRDESPLQIEYLHSCGKLWFSINYASPGESWIPGISPACFPTFLIASHNTSAFI